MAEEENGGSGEVTQDDPVENQSPQETQPEAEQTGQSQEGPAVAQGQSEAERQQEEARQAARNMPDNTKPEISKSNERKGIWKRTSDHMLKRLKNSKPTMGTSTNEAAQDLSEVIYQLLMLLLEGLGGPVARGIKDLFTAYQEGKISKDEFLEVAAEQLENAENIEELSPEEQETLQEESGLIVQQEVDPDLVAENLEAVAEKVEQGETLSPDEENILNIALDDPENLTPQQQAEQLRGQAEQLRESGTLELESTEAELNAPEPEAEIPPKPVYQNDLPAPEMHAYQNVNPQAVEPIYQNINPIPQEAPVHDLQAQEEQRLQGQSDLEAEINNPQSHMPTPPKPGPSAQDPDALQEQQEEQLQQEAERKAAVEESRQKPDARLAQLMQVITDQQQKQQQGMDIDSDGNGFKKEGSVTIVYEGLQQALENQRKAKEFARKQQTEEISQEQSQSNSPARLSMTPPNS